MSSTMEWIHEVGCLSTDNPQVAYDTTDTSESKTVERRIDGIDAILRNFVRNTSKRQGMEIMQH
jgi:hypothetical protein